LLHLHGICSKNSRSGCAEAMNPAESLGFMPFNNFAAPSVYSKFAAAYRSFCKCYRVFLLRFCPERANPGTEIWQF
jgi:hypothetical protein